MKYILIVSALVIGIALGMFIGVRDYKASCEKITDLSQTWLECN